MSPQSGQMLVDEIAPRLRSVIPRCVKTVGAEDTEELVQDAIVLAAQMLQRIEVAGKTVTAGNIAYYTILLIKGGRRSYGSSWADAMAPGTQIDGKSSVLSLEEEVGYDPELDEPITLGQLLDGGHEDPSTVAARNADWDAFVSSHDYRYALILEGIIEGRTAKETAAKHGDAYSRIYKLQNQMAEDVRAFMGDDAIADCVRVPGWAGTVNAERERAACRAQRKRESRLPRSRKSKGGK